MEKQASNQTNKTSLIGIITKHIKPKTMKENLNYRNVLQICRFIIHMEAKWSRLWVLILFSFRLTSF